MGASIRREVRSVELPELNRWIAQLNATRTRLVGIVLFLFGVTAFVLSFLGLLAPATGYYVTFAIALAAGITLITVGLHLSAPAARIAGETIVLATAVLWMFASVRGNLDAYGGLLHFIIGILALALFRVMRPSVGAVTFAALMTAYVVLLRTDGITSAAPPFNALVFCTFATIWAQTNYREKVGQFRTAKLLEESHQHARQLEALTVRDALTGLPNRRFFDTVLARRWEDCERSGEPFSLILLDVDNLKTCNDTQGHPEGDRHLRSIARVLRSTLGARGVCMRIGGDEFAVTPDRDSAVDIRALASELVAAVRHETKMTVSAGTASVIPSEVDMDEPYRRADRALYRAKALGRNRAERFGGRRSGRGT